MKGRKSTITSKKKSNSKSNHIFASDMFLSHSQIKEKRESKWEDEWNRGCTTGGDSSEDIFFHPPKDISTLPTTMVSNLTKVIHDVQNPQSSPSSSSSSSSIKSKDTDDTDVVMEERKYSSSSVYPHVPIHSNYQQHLYNEWALPTRQYEPIPTPGEPFMNGYREFILAVGRDPNVHLNQIYRPRKFDHELSVPGVEPGLVVAVYLHHIPRLHIQSLRDIVSEAFRAHLSRLIVFTTNETVSTTHNRTKYPQGVDFDHFGCGILIELRRIRELRYDITTLDKAPVYRRMSHQEALKETLRDYTHPLGWIRRSDTDALVQKHGCVAGDFIKIYAKGTTDDANYQACLVVPAVHGLRPIPLHRDFVRSPLIGGDLSNKVWEEDTSLSHEEDRIIGVTGGPHYKAALESLKHKYPRTSPILSMNSSS